MVGILGWLKQRRVATVAVSFSEPSRVRRYCALQKWPMTVLADPERKTYRAFKLDRLPLHRLFGPKTLLRYARLMWKGTRSIFYGGDDVFQAGGDFLIDREGNVLYAHRSHNPADRPTIDALRREIERHTDNA